MKDQDKQKRRDILAGRVAEPEQTNEEQSSGKSEARSDINYGKIRGIEGKTISGAGSTGTGDPGGDFDRPGTEGKPAVNDYVSKELEENVTFANDAREGDWEGIDENEDPQIPDNVKRSDPRSGFPAGGAARGPEDEV
jgi:hypothetical protein